MTNTLHFAKPFRACIRQQTDTDDERWRVFFFEFSRFVILPV